MAVWATVGNALMQLVFIVTGLVSIKSLTDMITQLVGQGDALKDGADTSKEVAKRIGQTAAVGVAGAGLAVKGAKLGMAVGRSVGSTVRNSKTGQRIEGGARALAGKASEKIGDTAHSVGTWARGTRTAQALGSAATATKNAITGSRPGKWVGRRTDSVRNFKQERERFANYRAMGYDTAPSWMSAETQDKYNSWLKRQAAYDKVKATPGVAKGFADTVYSNAKRDITYIGKDGKETNMWRDFAGTGQDFNKLVGGVTGFTSWYKQMESDDAVPGGDDGIIHKMMGSVFKFKNDKEKGGEQTGREAKAYSEANIQKLAEAFGHEYYMRDRNGNIVLDDKGKPQTIQSLSSMNVNADNITMDNKGNVTSIGNQHVNISQMPDVKIDPNTQIKLSDAQMGNLIRGMGSLSRTEQDIKDRLQEISNKLSGGSGGSGGSTP